MKTTALIILALCITSAAAGQIVPPSSEQLTQWVDFSCPIQLEAKRIERGYFFKLGEPVWVYGYSAEKDTRYAYIVGLYEANTLLLGEDRKVIEDRIRADAEKFAKMAMENPNHETEDRAERVNVETRGDGRNVYYSLMMLGPGGRMYGAFTTIGRYDLYLAQVVDSEDDLPADKELVEPAIPRAKLADIFQKLETYLVEDKKPANFLEGMRDNLAPRHE